MYTAIIIIAVVVGAYVLYTRYGSEGMTLRYSPFVTTLNRHVEKSGPDGDVVNRCGRGAPISPVNSSMDEDIKPERYLFNQIRGDNE